MTTLLDAARELGGLVAEVADADWRHPAWLALVGGTALLEAAARARTPRVGAGDLYATWLSANGGPRADTFMARDRPGAPASPVARARATASVLARWADELPGQPLLRTLAWRDGWLTREPLPPGPARVAFVTSRGAVLAELDAPGLEPALASYAAGGPLRAPLAAVDPQARAPTPAAIAVALVPEEVATARHLHRRAWTAGGGPWIGVGDAGPLEVVTTCHLVVDGYGHGRIASQIFAALGAPAGPPRAPVAPLPPVAGAEPLGFAAAALPAERIVFPRAAYAFGRALERAFRGHLDPALRRAARFSPTYQVPLVPGDRNDVERRRRRLLFGLVSVRMSGGAFEPYPEFRARLAAVLPREAAAAGLLSRVLSATSNVPLPGSWRRRLLASRGAPHPLLPPIEALAGRGSLSLIRYDDNELPAAPLYAVSAPALVDALGGVVLTLVTHGESCTASVAGSGKAGTEAGARGVLEMFREEMG